MSLHQRPPLLTFVAVALLTLPGCDGEDDPTDPGNGSTTDDTTVPGPVIDLQPLGVDGTEVTLAWTAPGDDGDTGTASEYDIRFGRSVITSSNWVSCFQCQNEPTPAVAGTEQSVTIDVGSDGVWAFALRTADEVPNWSTLSNNARVTIGSEPRYTVHQLTHSGSNRYPNVDDGFVVWVSHTVEGQEISIAGLTGAAATPNRLTDNGGEKRIPDNHGSERIVWAGRENATRDWEIWVYDKYDTPRSQALTDDDVTDYHPQLVGGGDIAWIRGSTMFGAVYYWDEAGHSRFCISDDCCPTTGWNNEMLSADAGEVIWRAGDRTGDLGYTLYRWDGTLTDMNDFVDAQLCVHYFLDDGTIAYETGNPRRIDYWDGTTAHEVGAGYWPSLDDGRVAYEFFDGHDWEIRYWDGTTVHEITDNDYEDYEPSLSGSLIAWTARPEGPDQIFYVDVERDAPGR